MNNRFDFNQSDESAFLARLKQGDEQAWNQFIQKYGTDLYEFFLNALSDGETAADLLSETLLAAVRKIHDFDGKVTLATFLFELAGRKLNEYYRRSRHSLDSGSGEGVQYNVLSEEVMRLFPQMPEIELKVLILRYQVGLGVDEIAQMLKKSDKSTEALLTRAKQNLSSLLASPGTSFTPSQSPRLSPWKSAIAMLEEQQATCRSLGRQQEAQIFASALDTLNSLKEELPPLKRRNQSMIYPQPPPNERKM